MFSGMAFGFIVVLFGLREEYVRISILMWFGGLGAVFFIYLIFSPFTTKKPFIPDDITDPTERRDQFEWALMMYGLLILFVVEIIWIIESLEKGGVPSNWGFFFGIIWVGSALFMSSPPVRDWIDRYYERNTSDMTDGT
jgi:hypothetical protein